jgi:S-adenosylmethionine:tRNA ribosyltransferase-isomerase
MNVSDFDYELPAAQIAQHPLPERDASRLLLLRRATGVWTDRQFREFPDLLCGDELIVVNNTRVLPARLFGRRAGNSANGEFPPGEIEVLLVRRLSADRWETLVRPGKKVPVGEGIVFGDGELEAVVEERGEFGMRVVRFRVAGGGGFAETIARLGHIPLPPYIKREDEPADRERYQTIFAREGAAVAAPTAGLHFTPAILERLRARGIEMAEITLDVGLGTFEPLRTELLEDHKIHGEAYEIPEATAAAIERARRDNRAILAVGTTVVRALEDAAEKNSGSTGLVAAGKAEAEIFLYPGKRFRVVNQLLTNFHLPQSSLLALVAAFAGRERVMGAYKHAVETGYRFYSYGDAMLIR